MFETAQPRDTVIAFGNPLLGDDGVGVAVLERLRWTGSLPSNVDLIDTSGSAIRALHALRGCRKAVLMDCALMGEKPGTLKRFLPDEVQSEGERTALFQHGGDALAILETASLLGAGAKISVLYGIQPVQMNPGEGLSRALEERLDEYVERILLEFD